MSATDSILELGHLRSNQSGESQNQAIKYTSNEADFNLFLSERLSQKRQHRSKLS